MSTGTLRLDPQQARNLIGAASLALGLSAVLAPGRTAAGFGLRSPGGALPLLVRMVGVRNAALGVRTLQATGPDQARAVQAGLALGVVDVTSLLLAARTGALSNKATTGALAVLVLFAALGAVAASPTS